ncbi:hypothetical protein TNCV_335561 [Trichonephila clavipes]|nr:hypothetical protein TNCV_335561 [Trichonephila clavipes]
MPLDNNAGSDRWPVRLQTRVRWSSALRLNRFITEDDTSPVCHIQVARGRQNPVDTAYDVGSVGVLADVGSLKANFDQSSPYGFS